MSFPRRLGALVYIVYDGRRALRWHAAASGEESPGTDHQSEADTAASGRDLQLSPTSTWPVTWQSKDEDTASQAVTGPSSVFCLSTSLRVSPTVPSDRHHDIRWCSCQ